eukprot:77303-Pleurochrysis_carterae.AAC.2
MQRAGAATTVARQASTGFLTRAVHSKIASYALMTARTVGDGVSNLEPFQSAVIRWYRGSRKKTLKSIQERNKMQNGETRMACVPNEHFRNNSVVNCEDR